MTIQFYFNQRVSIILKRNTNHSKSSFKSNDLPSNSSSANKLNIWLTFLHIFIINTAYSVTLTVTGDYIDSIQPGTNKEGFFLSLNMFSQTLATLPLSYISNFAFKTPIVVCAFLAGSSFLFYVSAGFFQNIWLIALARLTLGFVTGVTLTKRYVMAYSLSPDLRWNSMFYVSSSAAGIVVGPLLTLICYKLPRLELFGLEFNELTWPGYVALLMLSCLGVTYALLFTEPYTEGFSKTHEPEEPNTDQSSILEGNTQDYSVFAESFLMFTLFICKFLLELGVVSSVKINREFFESEDEVTFYKNVLLMAGNSCVLLVSLSIHSVLRRRRTWDVVIGATVIASAGYILNSSLISTFYAVFATGYITTVISLFIQEGYVSALHTKYLPTHRQAGILNSGFLMLVFASLGKFAGSNYADLLELNLFSLSKVNFLSSTGIAVCLVVAIGLLALVKEIRI